MKIDIHTHTRKVKVGDAETRHVDTERFVEIIKNTDIKILAITNHNYFDKKQYEEFRDGVIENCEIWPGIELDILENNRRSHLLVICNPQNYQKFDEHVKELLHGNSPDFFTISLAATVKKFDNLDCLYIAHYMTKKPNLDEEEIETLIRLVKNPKRIIKEATNAISAGIYITHGHNAIYGSDIQNWDNYVDISKDLPELRLPVESFEQFCLLLEKDETAINTLLNKKVKENIEINPFNNVAELIRFDIYNDINILFGSKGTGKTEILEALSKHFNGKGHKTSVYKSNDTHLKEVFDLRGTNLDLDASAGDVEECIDEIEQIRNAEEVMITSLATYHNHYSAEEKNKISAKLKIKNLIKGDEKQSKRKFKEVTEIISEFEKFRSYNDTNKILNEFIDAKTINDLNVLLSNIINQLRVKAELNFFDSKCVKLLNQIITVFNKEISKKTGQPEKPTRTGFSDYASNRIKLELATSKIINNLNKKITPLQEYAGSLGNKGELFCTTNIAIQNGSFSEPKYVVVRNVTKTVQTKFAKQIISISKHVYETDLFEKVAALNELDNIDSLKSVNCLMLFYKHFTLNDKIYEPSNGESSMILLHKELQEEKEFYLIDEPEKSLGNDYINDVIVPMLKEKALLGKKVIVATHDANIAVRTLPYNSIYRIYENNRHYTMTGNPFSNSLKCIYQSRPELDWKEISMKTLEGGEEAFGERGKIYGK